MMPKIAPINSTKHVAMKVALPAKKVYSRYGNARSGEQTHAQEGAADEVQGEGGEQQVQQDLEECLHVRMCLWWVSLGMPDINFLS